MKNFNLFMYFEEGWFYTQMMCVSVLTKTVHLTIFTQLNLYICEFKCSFFVIQHMNVCPSYIVNKITKTFLRIWDIPRIFYAWTITIIPVINTCFLCKLIKENVRLLRIF